MLDTFKFFHTLASEGMLGPTSDIFEVGTNFFTDMLTKWMPKQRYAIAIGCNVDTMMQHYVGLDEQAVTDEVFAQLNGDG